MSRQLVDLFTELGPVITSGGFITFLSALQLNGYMTEIVDAISRQVIALIPGGFDLRLPGGKIIKALLSMLLAIAILGIVYVYVILPIYTDTVEDQASAE